MPKPHPEKFASQEQQTQHDGELLNQADQVLETIATARPEKELQEIKSLTEKLESLYKEVGVSPDVRDIYARGDIVSGKITEITKYGAYVKLPHTEIKALVHISWFKPIEKMEEVLKVGQTHNFEIIKLDIDELKVGLKPIEEKERQMEFEALGGRKITVTQETEKYGMKVGQKIRSKTDTSTKNRNGWTIIGFTKEGEVVTKDDDIVGVIGKTSLPGWEIVPENGKPRQMKFEDVGGEEVMVDEELEKFGLKVGQKIRIKDSKKAAMERNIRDAKELTIAGFDKNDEGCIVIQIDGGQVTYTYYPDPFNDFYETIEEKPAERQVEFTNISGEKIGITPDLLESEGVKVGQRIKLKDNLLKGVYEAGVSNAKEMKIVGFPKRHENYAVIQLDGDRAVVINIYKMKKDFIVT